MNLKKLMFNIKPVKIPALKCQDCGDIIFSRTQRDCRHCSCGKIFVDGGFTTYGGRHGFSGKIPIPLEITVDASRAELYTDWNEGIDKFGRIKNGTISGIRRGNRRARP